MEFIYNDDKSNCWYKDVCGVKAAGKCNEFCLRHYKMEYLVSQSLLGEKDKYPVALYPDADGTDREEFKELKHISSNILDFVNQGRNLVISSRITGNGKTAWSKKLLLSYFNAIWASTDLQCRGLFIDMQLFFNKLRENINQPNDYIKTVSNYEHGYFLSYLNSRIDAGKANIFTSNLSEAELRDRLGDRLYSRIVLGSKLIELKGKDKRMLNKW